jgi:hypothetical protein
MRQVRILRTSGTCGDEWELSLMTSRRTELFVLVPSPLVGPASWTPVARALARRGRKAIVTGDAPEPTGREPAWQATVRGVSKVLRDVPLEQPLVLLAHSAAGPLLPAIGGALARSVAAYVLVDGRMPTGGRSRLEAIGAEAAARRAELEAGRPYPIWTDDDLCEEIPHPEQRRALLAELRPRGLEFWTEPLPTVAGWPNAPCGYLRFSDPYRPAAEEARRAGWLVRELPAGHFHPLVDPGGVADALLELLDELVDPDRPGMDVARGKPPAPASARRSPEQD